jgi:hypothetical protein
MPIVTDADYIRVPGKVDILVAFPSVYGDLFKLGESENGIEIRKVPLTGRVSGDRYGGNEGPPIENQFFGLQVEVELAMSRWDPAQLVKLERMGGVLATAGVVPLNSVGALLQRDNGIRFLFFSRRDNTLSVNLPCCTWSSPQSSGRGTKYSVCRFSITGNRAPEGFWHSGSVGVVYNADLTGVPPEQLNP